MSFVQRRLDKKVNQSRGIFDTFIYKTEDTIADVGAAGYFSDSRFAEGNIAEDPEWDGAKIEVRSSDGYAEGFVDGSTGTWTASLSSV